MADFDLDATESPDLFFALLDLPQDLSGAAVFSFDITEPGDSFFGNVNVDAFVNPEITLYFAQTPISTPLPTANEIINGTATDGVFWNVVAPVGNVVNYYVTQRTDVQNNVSYRVSGVATDGVNPTDVAHSDTFTITQVDISSTTVQFVFQVASGEVLAGDQTNIVADTVQFVIETAPATIVSKAAAAIVGKTATFAIQAANAEVAMPVPIEGKTAEFVLLTSPAQIKVGLWTQVSSLDTEWEII